MEMQAVRVRGRQLKSQLAKLEYKLEMKDQLQLDTGNLHAVDYEQLKIENESLNAKIHLKNEALSVLRKKTQCLVHTLTHVREKLQFIVVGCKVDGEALATDDKNLHGARIKLSKIKSSIMAIRRKKDGLQKNSVSVTSPMTLDDMEYQREDIEAEEKRLQATKKRYTELSVKIEESKNKAYSLGVIPKPTKKKGSAKDPPLERGNLRWGIRREVLGQVVVGDMVDQMAEQMAAKSLCLST